MKLDLTIEVLQNIIAQLDKDQERFIKVDGKPNSYLEGRKDAFTFALELLQEAQNDRNTL